MNKSEYVKLDQTCRICLRQEDEMIWMLENSDRVKNLYKLISLVFESEIVFGKMSPKFICEQCENNLKLVRDFKMTLLRTNRILNECLKTAEMTPDDSNFIGDQMYSLSKTIQVETKLQSRINNSFQLTISKEKTKKMSFVEIPDETTCLKEINNDQIRNKINPTQEEIKEALNNLNKLYTIHKNCIKCGLIFEDCQNLHLHYQTQHNDISKQICLICNKIIDRNMNSHNVTHFKCPFCRNIFITKQRFISHLLKYCSDQLLICKNCSFWFNSQTDLQQHIKLEHTYFYNKNNEEDITNQDSYNQSQKKLQSVENSINYPSDKKRHLCNFCGKLFTTGTLLRIHLRSHTGEKPFSCDMCNARFTSRASLRDHKSRHAKEKPFVCETCGLTFASRKLCYTHRHSHMPRTICCSICPKKFRKMSYLNVHMRTHSGEKPFQCKICLANFAHKMYLSQHIRLTHSDKRPFRCEQCGKSFKSHTNYQKHVNTHSGIKPFRCTMCDYNTAYSFSLTLHAKKHHPEQNIQLETFIYCDICQKQFSSEVVLNAHKQLRHKTT